MVDQPLASSDQLMTAATSSPPPRQNQGWKVATMTSAGRQQSARPSPPRKDQGQKDQGRKAATMTSTRRQQSVRFAISILKNDLFYGLMTWLSMVRRSRCQEGSGTWHLMHKVGHTKSCKILQRKVYQLRRMLRVKQGTIRHLQQQLVQLQTQVGSLKGSLNAQANLPPKMKAAVQQATENAAAKSSHGNRYSADWIIDCLLIKCKSPAAH